MNPAEKEGTEEVEIELKDDDILDLALMAHKQDITLNELIIRILEDYISLIENK